MIFGSHTNQRFMDGLTDAVLDTEEVLGQMDCHDLAYSRGLRTGRALLGQIIDRQQVEEYTAKMRDLLDRTTSTPERPVGPPSPKEAA